MQQGVAISSTASRAGSKDEKHPRGMLSSKANTMYIQVIQIDHSLLTCVYEHVSKIDRTPRKNHTFRTTRDMRVDSSPWGTFLVILTVVGFVMACRYTCSLIICHQADNTAESSTELQQVLVVHPDGGEAIAKRLQP